MERKNNSKEKVLVILREADKFLFSNGVYDGKQQDKRNV